MSGPGRGTTGRGVPVPDPAQRERFWQGVLAGLVLSSAVVGGIVGLVARLRGRSSGAPKP